jgi:hypothetical protein
MAKVWALLNWLGAEYCSGPLEDGNELCDSLKGDAFLQQLSESKFLKEELVSSCYLQRLMVL